ncbi:dihydrouridine synthase family protein [Mycobacterium xenopi 4042]|uniref:Dihydrouridine synthase family protein n=1 Tax=Mycobacterium xenopi 4042 TaxID=1299334 RepID=X7ZXT3_MYCXE|nr:dihydrouridine synthase family protein [Mycobacterium xenopi 4042]
MTVKFRIGIDDDHHTHLDAGRIAESEGAAAVALHARTAAQRYSGAADWEQIARLKEQVRTIPVLGNGDIFDASDALTMMAATGCDGVVIGRGCLGRPWLFAELSAAFTGRPAPPRPCWVRSPTSSAGMARCWPRISAKTRGCVICASTSPGTCMDFRRARSYGGRWRWSKPSTSSTFCWDDSTPMCRSRPRLPAAGRQGSPARVALPDGWLSDRDDCTVPAGADIMHSGG